MDLTGEERTVLESPDQGSASTAPRSTQSSMTECQGLYMPWLEKK